MNLKALILLIAGHFVTDMNTGALPAFLPFIKESFHLSYTMAASIILVFNVTSSVIQPVFGSLVTFLTARPQGGSFRQGVLLPLWAWPFWALAPLTRGFCSLLP